MKKRRNSQESASDLFVQCTATWVMSIDLVIVSFAGLASGQISM